MFHYSYDLYLKPCTVLSPKDQLSILRNILIRNEYINIEDNETRINYYLNEVLFELKSKYMHV